MKERIRKLAEQAFNEYESVYKSDANIPKEFTEKLAELIVWECIDYCGENISKTVGGALKIHFGVEE